MNIIKYAIIASLLLLGDMANSQQSRTEKGVVTSYEGIQVFYHCKPLHPYYVLGEVDTKVRTTHIREVFRRYAAEAQYNFPACTGIIIDDVQFGHDHYQAIMTLQQRGYHDTAVFDNSAIFMSAKPTRPYEVVNTVKLMPSWMSLQKNLDRLPDRAHDILQAYDGIIVNDIDFGFGKSDIMFFCWTNN